MHDKQLDKDRKTIHTDASKSIEDAHKRAKNIIESAVERAKDTLLKTEYIREDVIRDLDKNLHNVSEATVGMLRNEALSFNKEYKIMLETIQVEHAKMLEEARAALKEVEYLKKDLHEGLQVQVKDILESTKKNISQEAQKFDSEYVDLLTTTKEEYLKTAREALTRLEKIPENELLEFQTILKTETLSAQKILGSRINDLFTAAEKEVSTYKEQRMKEIDSQISAITGKVLEEVVGKKLTRADQESLIMKSLESAKTEGFVPKPKDNPIA
jgi:F0F1-type ATP synthase membrane subunit b/b'